MGKAPASQWYFKDWLGDAELQAASASTRGAWMNCLCLMWQSKTRGEITLINNLSSISRTLNCTVREAKKFLDELPLGFCEVSRNSNEILTLRNRRMYRGEKERENARLRQRRHYDKRKSNGDITPPSPTPSPKNIYVEQARRIFLHWQEKMQKPKAKFTRERRARIEARLKEGYSEQDCMEAVTNISKSKFHTGDNDRNMEYNSIELIFRDGSHLERYRDMKPKKQTDWFEELPEV